MKTIKTLVNKIRNRNAFVDVSDPEEYNKLLAKHKFLKEVESSASVSFFKSDGVEK